MPSEADFGWILTVVGSSYLVAINFLAFFMMGWDKRLAKKEHARRISEKSLFLSAILGGSIGAFLGMRTFRHKTRHWYFVVGMPLILILQLALVGWVLIQ